MRQIVLDTSVVIKWFIPEKGRNKAIALRDDHIKNKIKLCSRDLLLYEFVSSLKNYSKMRLQDKDFAFAVETLQSVKIGIYPLNYADLPELFILAKKLNISIYDCSYLLLAKKLRAPLYTADKKLFLASKSAVASFFI